MEKIKAGVIGTPISHSLSPVIHNYWLKKHKINGDYQAINVKKEELHEFLKSFNYTKLIGFNITLPHKEEVFNVIKNYAEIDIKTQKLGAVNCVYKKNDKIYATNTDYYGFKKSLEMHVNFSLENKKIALIGLGGAAKAILYGLLEEKNNIIYLINRTKEKADIYQEKFRNQVVASGLSGLQEMVEGADLIINASSMGLNNENNIEINFANIKKEKLFYDIVYKPEITKFLQDAMANKHKIITGIGMLVYQAIPAFAHFFAQEVQADKQLFKKINNIIYG
jgi:shikimate dehydrogenase